MAAAVGFGVQAKFGLLSRKWLFQFGNGGARGKENNSFVFYFYPGFWINRAGEGQDGDKAFAEISKSGIGSAKLVSEGLPSQ